jgi:hypothetical protein
LVGSVAEQVLRRAPCPVLTVRASLERLPQAARKQDLASLQASK